MDEVVKITNWYALVCKSRAEKKVFARLSAAGHEVFLPLVVELKQWSDRIKKVEKPLVPSYVFVKTEAKTLNTYLEDIGVVRVFKYLGKPAVISQKEIDILKVSIEQKGVPSVFEKKYLIKGTPVQIIKGPFKGLDAQCVQHQGKFRIVIETKALGVAIALNVPLNYIKKM
ncbi:MAG: UpxY family transcription antiterminator [Flavicella sp.]